MAINNVPNKYILNRNRSDGRLWKSIEIFLEVDRGRVEARM
jgi:hypothetical protein